MEIAASPRAYSHDAQNSRGTTPANLNPPRLPMTRTVVFCSLRQLVRSIVFLFLLSLMAVPSMVRSQDAIRPSLAGETAAQARRQDIDRLPYNLLLGPIRFRVSATLGVEYNDNINLSEVNEQEDFILRPQLTLNALWPVTQLNTLTFDLGLGYAWYLDHSNANTNGLLISPGSQIAFDVFIGDFRINFHERPSLQQDPIGQLALSNVVDYGRFENTAGVSVLWDLNKAILTLGYDHYNFISTAEDFDYLNRNAELLAGTISFAATSTTNVGVEAYSAFSYYDQNVLNDSLNLSIGAFVETQLSSNLKLRVAGGYQWIDFDNNGIVNDSNDLSDYYANVLIGHRLNSVIRHSISAGHESQLGVNSNYIVLNYVRHTITWNIIRNTLLGTEVFYEDADDSGGFISEHLHRYGGAVTVGYQLTPHVTLGLRYQYTQKDSDVAFRDYKQNRVSVDGTYSF